MSALVRSGFLRVVTPPPACARPTPLAVALEVVKQIRRRPHAVPIRPGSRSWAVVELLLRAPDAPGPLGPAASHAALAIVSGCGWLTTERDGYEAPDCVPTITPKNPISQCRENQDSTCLTFPPTSCNEAITGNWCFSRRRIISST